MTGWGNLLLGHPLAEQRGVFQGESRAVCVSVPSPVQPFLLDHCMDLLEGGAGRSGHFWVHLSLLWGSHLAFVPSPLDCWTNTPFCVFRPVPTVSICLSFSLLWGQRCGVTVPSLYETIMVGSLRKAK